LIDVAENLLSANWTKEGGFGTVTANYGIAPDGTQTSTRLQYSSGYFYRSTTTSPAITALTSGTTITFSCWVRGVTQPGRGIGLWSYAVGGIVTASTQSINQYSWTRVSLTYTIAAGATSFAIMLAGAPSNIFQGDIEVWRPQLEVQGFVTPYVLGTRSNTQAVVDLTNKNTNTVNSLTYASDNTFSFNGSNSITVPFNSSEFTFNNGQTIIIWMKNQSPSSARRNPYDQAYAGAGTITHENDTGFNYFYGTGGSNNSPYTNLYTSFNVVVGETAMICFTRDTSTVSCYKNGVFSNSMANPYGSVVTGTNNITIGSGYAGGFGGSIYAVQLYNRALTAAEVQQNFNAIKSRYTPGSSATNPALNATQIRSFDPSASDGSYWYQPSGYSTPILCYTNFSTAPAGKGYVLVATGRESTNWWDNDGQNTVGLAGATGQNTPISVAPGSFVNGLIGGNWNLMKMLVNRINGNDSWYFQGTTSATFSWAYFPQNASSVNASATKYSGLFKNGSVLLNWATGSQWTDTLNIGGGNDCDRTFTWSWGGHGSWQGWSGGSSCTPAGSFQNGGEGHAIQLVNCYIEC
jgi:hypothetical protein